MRIVIIDGQGGGMGRALIEGIRANIKEESLELIAVGTNPLATVAMLKAGATAAATGENAIIYNCSQADVIIGAIGIAFGNSMYGEISPDMAAAVSISEARKFLIPNTKCNATVIGVTDKSMASYIQEVIEKLKSIV